MDIQTLIDDAKATIVKIEDAVRSNPTPPPTNPGGNLIQAMAKLQDLHDQLGTVEPDNLQAIGKIFIEVGTIVETFFPNFAQEGAFLVAVGTALEQGGTSGSVGPIRIGNTGYTVTWAPWA